MKPIFFAFRMPSSAPWPGLVFLAKSLYLVALAGSILISGTVVAQTGTSIKLEAATISVTGIKPAGTAAGGDLTKDWTRVNFSQTFTRTPYVFTVPTMQGANAGAHRIRNVTTTGFYIRSVEPHTFDGAHVGMQVTYLAVEACDGGETRCAVNVPLSGGGSEQWMIGHVDTVRWVGWGQNADNASNWQSVNFPSAFSAEPALLAQVQTIANETGLSKTLPKSLPWLTSAIKNVGKSGFDLSLERSEATESGTGNVTANERIAWIAAPPGGRKSLLDAKSQPVGYEIIRTGNVIKGWDDGKVYTYFSSPWTTAPQVIASLNSRNNREPVGGDGTRGDGGWLRRDTDTAAENLKRTGYVIDETHHASHKQDGNRKKNLGEAAGIFVFERAFSIDPIALDHFRIVHDGAGQTCTPESITLKACANSTCTSLYSGSVTLGLAPGASDSNATWSGAGVSGDTVFFAGGQTTVNLTYSKAGAIALGAAGTPIPTNSTKCELSGVVGSCSFTVGQCTIRPFEACDGSNSACDETATNLYTKVSGNGNVVLDLVKILTSGASKGKRDSSFATTASTTVAVDLVAGSANTDPATGCPTPLQVVAGSAIGNVSFSGGRANDITVLPAANNTQAVKDVRVRFVLTQGGSASTSCTTDSFAIRPAYFTVTSTNATSNKTLPPAAPGLVAGSSFGLTAQAKSKDGLASIGYNGTPVLDISLVESCMANSAAEDKGACPNPSATTRLQGSFGAAVAATAAASGSFVYDEAGGFKLGEDAVVDDSFASGDAGNQGCIAGDTGNTAGIDPAEDDFGKVGCSVGSKASGKGSQDSQEMFGRFYPAMYSLDSGSVVAGCGTFTYMGQDFSLNASISARNQGDTKTLTRYRAGKVVMGADRASALGTNLSPGTVSTTDSDPTWTDGTVNIEWKNIKYTKPASATDPISDLQLGLRVVDGDNRPMKVPDLLTDYKKISGGVPEFRFGRLRLFDTYGSLSPLRMPVETHYWSGKSWVKNAGDSCTTTTTTTTSPLVTFSADPATGWTLTPEAFSGGSMANKGLKLEKANSGETTITASAPAWLKPDPTAKASIGIFGTKESRKAVHIRETY